MCGNAGRVRQRVLHSGCFEGAQAQDATIANATGLALPSVTRPGQIEGRAQLEATADDLSLAECDERRGDCDVRGLGADADNQVESVIVLGAAIRVAGAVLRDRADVDLFRSQ